MKRLITFLLLCVFSVPAFAATKMYVSTEKVYGFSTENLAETIPEFIEDEKKQNAVADKYTELMDENGNVSVADLFEICRTAGFNTYREAGFHQCSLFIAKLAENAEIELEFTTLSGYCPGADEKGNNPNGLRSINENTRIGDMCSSTNINYGEVIFRKGYNCTCFAMGCNDGYSFDRDAQGNLKEGRCITVTSDQPQNNKQTETKDKCTAVEVPFSIGTSISEIMSALQRAKNTCNAALKKLGCTGEVDFKSFLPDSKDINRKVIVCNPSATQIADFKKLVEKKKADKKKAAQDLKYYEVCGKDKGKSGGKEYCIEDFFNWTRTQTSQGIGFAQKYAQSKNHHEIFCDTKYRTELNDDYLKCSTLDGKNLYEFKFDTLEESIDNIRQASERGALCRLMGGSMDFLDKSNNYCKKIGEPGCRELSRMGEKYGIKADFKDDICLMYTEGSMSSEDFDKKLAKIEGLDNRKFYAVDVIKYRNKFDLDQEIEQYVKNHLPNTEYVRCDPGWTTVKVADGWLAQITGDHDDVLRCYADGVPVDFVFNDLSEFWNYQRDAGEQGVKCISFNSNNELSFDGQHCRGMTKQECNEFEVVLKKELDAKGWTGDDDLVDWDEAAGACEINSAQFANNLNTTVKVAAMAVGTVIALPEALAAGGVAAVAAGIAAGIEVAGIVGEQVNEYNKQNLQADWARDILRMGKMCNDSKCADDIIRNCLHRTDSMQGQIDPNLVQQVDDEMTRLGDLLSENELAAAIANAREPNCWETLECQEKMYSYMQMASVATMGVGALKGFLKKAGMRLGTKGTTKSTALVVRGESQAASVVKAENSIDDVAKATGTTAGKTANTAEKAKTVVYNAEHFKANPSAADDIFKNADNSIVQVNRQNMPASTARDLMKKAREHGFVCSDCGGEVLIFSRTKKATDAAADIAKLRNKASSNLDAYIKQAKQSKTGLGEAGLPYSRMSESEWKALEKELEKEGIGFTRKGDYMYLQDKTRKAAETATDAAANIAKLRNKASSNLDAHIKQAKQSKTGIGEAGLPYSRMSESEWKALEKELEKEGVGFTRKGDLMFLQDKTRKAAETVADAGKGANAGKNLSKAEKIDKARKEGNLGYHGTDADISMDDMIRPSKNTSDALGGVGYGIADSYDAAEGYAIKRLIERQNIGKNIKFTKQGKTLVVESNDALNLSNKTGYVYTTAKDANVQFEGLSNGYVGFFGAAKMPNSVEVLGKSTFNLDDLIKSGRVKIVSKTTDGAASTSKAAKTVDTATDAGNSASKAANNAGTGKTVYAETIMDKKMYKTKNVTNEDSIWTVTEVSPGSSKYYVDVYEGAHKKILSNPSFLEGAKKTVLGRNTLEVVKKGTAHLDDSGKIVLDTPPEVILR